MAKGGAFRQVGPTAIEQLATWSLQVTSDAIPQSDLDQAKLLLLDTIGCAYAGHVEEAAHGVLAVTSAEGGAPQASVIGTGRKASLRAAVLANGTLCRVLDLNDYVMGDVTKGGEMGGHPSDNIPVALAAAEMAGSSGRDMLAAIVVGYEVFARVRDLMGRGEVWDGVTVSALVAPAMAGRLLGLDAGQLANAMGLSLAHGATSAAVRAGHISAAKSIANSLVAERGVLATLMAKQNVTGPLALFEQPDGMQTVFPRLQQLDGLWGPMPARSYVSRANVKAYPCLATGQSIVAAGLQIHKLLGGRTDRIEKIQVVLGDYHFVKRQQTDPARIDPNSKEAADHSFNFLAAVSIIDGKFGLAQYDNTRWDDAKVRALMGPIEFANDPDLTRRGEGAYPCRIEVTEAGGKTHIAEVPYPPGFSKGGLAPDAVIAKFKAITAEQLRATDQDRLVDAVLAADKQPSLAGIVAALAPIA